MSEISHAQAREYLQPGVVADLSDVQRAALDAHLAACSACRAEAEALAALEARVGRALHARWDADRPARDPLERVTARTRPAATRRLLGFAGGVAGLALIIGLIALLTGRFAQPPAPAAIATPLPGTTPTLAPFDVKHNPGVADLLARRPAPGQSVEVDAYFSGAGVPSMPGWPSVPEGVACPMQLAMTLTDRPYPAVLKYLNVVTAGNQLPDDAAWLIAALPEQAQPGARNLPALPYHARLRGHLDEPAFAQCADARRIFVIEAVVHVYEQDLPDPSIYTLSVPADYAAWPRYAEAAFGYSVVYPPGWQVERLDERAVAFRSPLWPGNPVIVRVHAGETHYDYLSPDSAPPLLQGRGFGAFQQGGWPWDAAGVATQGLAGHQVDHDTARAGERGVSVLLSGGGNTYEIALDYPTGFAASPALLADYTAMVMGFRLDVLPGPSPTPPIHTELGAGPFLTQWQALDHAEQTVGNHLELITARLVPEAEARRQGGPCDSFSGHPEGVWLLETYGEFYGPPARRMRLYLDALSGYQLCGEEMLEPLPRWVEYESALAQAFMSFAPHALCEWDLLGQAPGEAYVWAYCVAMGTDVETAVSAPAVVRIGADGHVTDIAIPGDGTLYAPDVKRLFPAGVQALIFGHTGNPDEWAVSVGARKVEARAPWVVEQGTLLP